MAYIKFNPGTFGSYGGLAGIWGHGTLPSITVDTDEGKLTLPRRLDHYSSLGELPGEHRAVSSQRIPWRRSSSRKIDLHEEEGIYEPETKVPWYKQFSVDKPFWEKYW